MLKRTTGPVMGKKQPTEENDVIGCVICNPCSALPNILVRQRVKGDEMGGARSTHGRDEECTHTTNQKP